MSTRHVLSTCLSTLNFLSKWLSPAYLDFSYLFVRSAWLWCILLIPFHWIVRKLREIPLDRKVKGLEGRKSSHASNFRICCCVLSSTSYSQPQLVSVPPLPTSKEDEYYSVSSSANLLSATKPSASRRFPSSSLRCTRSIHLEFTRSRSSNNAHQHWADVAKSSLALDASDSPLCLKTLLTSLIGWRWSLVRCSW